MSEVCYGDRLRKIFLLEDENLENAITEMKNIVLDFPQDEINLLYELSKMHFRHCHYLEALQGFIQCYNCTQDEEILKFILECYYEPNFEEYENNYKINKECIAEYPYFFGQVKEDSLEKNINVVWKDEEILIYFYKGYFITRTSFGIMKEMSDIQDRFLLINENSTKAILEYINICSKSQNDEWEKRYFYLYYAECDFSALIQTVSIKEILFQSHIIFLIGEDWAEKFFMDFQILFPSHIMGSEKNEFVNFLQRCNNKKQNMMQYYVKCNQEYYQQNKDAVIRNIIDGNPKILFITSKHTTVLQYSVRDMALAADKLGLQTKISIEKSDIYSNTNLGWIYEIFSLKPDIIFMMDHFRFELANIILEEIVCMTWIQDPMPYVMDAQTPLKLKERDIILNHFTTWKKFKKIGYSAQRVIAAPIPANCNIYKPYELTEEEIEKYSCDICLVCHASDIDENIEENLTCFFKGNELIENMIKNMVREYVALAYLNETFLYSTEQFKDYIISYFLMNSMRITNEEGLDELAESLYCYTNSTIFRKVIVDWIIEAGFENIKLWGDGWLKNEKYEKYAMGRAENGETLSKIYQASKIVIGNNTVVSGTSRAWESMLSGSFYMSNYIPEEEDASDIRQILKVEEELVMFYDKKDLLTKLEFYLSHEEERQKMIQIGREKTLEKMTYESLMKKTLQEMKKMF